VDCVIRECLKLGVQNHFLDGIPLLFSSAELLSTALKENERLTRVPDRLAIGQLLRHPSVHDRRFGITWQESLLFSLVIELTNHYDVETDDFDDKAASTIALYNEFARLVHELDLAGAGDMRPVLDGREVVSVLGAARPGPWTGKVLARVVDWQLEHPGGTKDACVAWLKEEHAAGRLEVATVTEPPAKKARTSQ
ncbi:hypothetical protein GGF50DRAFT_56688, partial [Schizophyllum commune]